MPTAADARGVTQAVLWRVAAAGPFAVAVLANMAYRPLRQARDAGSPRLAEIALCLVAFTATWVGVLLLLHGRRLFHPADLPYTDAPAPDPLRVISSPPFEDRHAMAQMLTAQMFSRVREAHRRNLANGASDPPQPR